MTLNLDARQRAMLMEMGVRLWSPPDKAPPMARAPTQAAPPTTPALTPASVARTAPLSTTPETPRSAPRAAPLATPAPAPLSLSPLPAGLAQMDWAALQTAAASCQACGLCQGRQHSLFANRSVAAGETVDWLIVGDAPTQAEDLAGQAFVGDEGLLLDAMLQALGLSRTGDNRSVVVTSAVKCHPPDNRNPAPEEIAHCQAYLKRQIDLLQPRVVLALGRLAAQALLHDSLGEAAAQPLGKLRGQAHAAHGTQVVVSYHPTYLLRSPSEKAKAWADLCLAKSLA
ncbi:MAG: hypothetical protein RI998_924 [Pseudomonadota bacterium]